MRHGTSPPATTPGPLWAALWAPARGWLHAHPDRLGLLRIIWPFLASAALLLALATVIFWLMSAGRAYVDGESRWSKAQRDGLLSLLRYRETCDRRYFTDYQDYLLVPHGDQLGRDVMDRSPVDVPLARRGLVQGNNHPADVDGMIFVYRYLRSFPEIREAVADWRAADATLHQMERVAAELDEAVQVNCHEARSRGAFTDELYAINAELATVQASFSLHLGEANRLIFTLSVAAMAVISLLLCALGTALSHRVVRANLQSQREAEAANRTKSDFLANMSHEIRTPMNGVIGLIDVLEQSGLNHEQRETAALIRSSGQALLGVLEDILDFSKIEAGQLQIERIAFDSALVIEQACGVLDRNAQDKAVDILVFIAPEVPGTVLGDPLRLRQVAVNLVSNAVKFSARADRRGAVRVRWQPAAGTDGRPGLALTVHDDGIGMDAAAQQRLFQPFSQADLSTTRRYGGTGLGLAITRQLVTGMGGAVSVHSAPEQGSCFTVWLPLVRPDDGPAAVASEHRFEPLRGLPCLVVGAPDGSARELAHQLVAAGAQVVVADSIAAAQAPLQAMAQALAADAPALCLIDDPANQNLLDQWTDAIAAAQARPRWALVQLGRGKRRRMRPRLGGPGQSLDASGLTRHQWLTAMASLASPEASLPAPSAAATATATTAAEAPHPDPASPPPAAAASLPAPAAQHAERILVAEDNPANQKVIAFQLRKLGYAADVAPDGAEALAMFNRGAYDLLLTDLHMPNMDGYQLAAALRVQQAQRADGRRLPVIALTANAQSGEAERCRRSGLDDFMTKPTGLNPLGAMLQKWLHHGEHQAASADERRAATTL
jgi:signal transduction histidine kinase/CheY-like chemotaxis protein